MYALSYVCPFSRPMFEDDVPSVLELEMEDLEKWMVKDSESHL